MRVILEIYVNDDHIINLMLQAGPQPEPFSTRARSYVLKDPIGNGKSLTRKHIGRECRISWTFDIPSVSVLFLAALTSS